MPPKLCCGTDLRRLLLWLLLGLALRGAAAWHFRADRSDPDGYVALAEGLRAGRGFAAPGTSTPTAYRPPLYPCVLAVTGAFANRGLLFALHGVLFSVTLWCVGRVTLAWNLSPLATHIALGIVSLDPISLRYFALPMTETMAACFSAMLLWLFSLSKPITWRRAICLGAVFGLACLCRPTFWTFGGLLALSFGWRCCRAKPRRWSIGIVAVLSAAVGTAPWVIRNQRELGSPILMTTHGGYTLLLGNNAAFYREVVEQPWGTVWDGSRGPGQAVWAEGINGEMDAAGLQSEVERDAWMQRLAWSTIRSQPVVFARACLLKFSWFWNPGPHDTSPNALPRWLLWGIRAFYCVLWVGLIAGSLRMLRRSAESRRRALPALLLIVAFTGMHLVYWSDARMRAPLLPAIALLVAAGCTGTNRRTASGMIGP